MGLLHHLAREACQRREAAGLRQIDVGSVIGVTHATISRFENAEFWPTDADATVYAYAKATGVRPADIWLAAVVAMLEHERIGSAFRE